MEPSVQRIHLKLEIIFKLPTQEILVNYLEQCKYPASCQTKEKSVSQSDITGLTKSFKMYILYSWASQVAHMVKKICPQCRRPGFDSWVWKIPWRRKQQSNPALLPGKSHGWRSLIDRLQSLGLQMSSHNLATKQQIATESLNSITGQF